MDGFRGEYFLVFPHKLNDCSIELTRVCWHQQDRHLMAIVSELTPAESDDDDDEDECNDEKPRHAPNSARDIPWPIVSQRLGTFRTSAECMKRYTKLTGQRQSEKTAALKGPWTAEEDRKITTLVMAHGAKRWSQIAAELPGEFLKSVPIGSRQGFRHSPDEQH